MKPSLQKILSGDYLAILSGLFPIVMWLLFIDSLTIAVIQKLLGKGINDNDPAIFMWIAICTTILFVPIFYYRIQSIYLHFRTAIEVEGIITRIVRYKDRGRIEFDYIYEDQAYHAGNAIHRNKFTRSLKERDAIILAVSPTNPQKALIKGLYIQEE